MRSKVEVDPAVPLDAGLASLARAEAGMRLRLGQVLEVLGRGRHFELGFSSVAAYALERCDRSVRWVEAARSLARRLEPLRELRCALAFGNISWSMAELLARVARPEDEAAWMEAAQSRTVRQMRARVHQAISAAGQDAALEALHGDETCTLTCTVDQEDAWLFEATRALLEQLGVQGADAQVEALLAEAQGNLLEALPPDWVDLEGLERVDTAQRSWEHELGRWRAEAEARCEPHFRDTLVGNKAAHQKQPAPVHDSVACAAAFGLADLEGMSARDLDGVVRGVSRALSRHELELSRLILQFHRADGWRRLGYATETQYASERLGMARSSFAARRALALRLEKLPRVAEALGAGQVGVEAAVQVVRVATPNTEAAWVGRARQRTIKHLREEVAAALVAVRLSGEADCPPPVDAEMDAFHELERAVVSGRVCQPRPANDQSRERDESVRWAEPASPSRRAWLVMLGSLAGWLDGWLVGGLPMSAARVQPHGSNAGSKGRVELRLRVSRANYAWWRGLEAQSRRWLPRGTSWLRLLCLSIWTAWRHLLGASVAYGHIYIRDRYRCSSPVCNRRDVTPHHLQFRSAGGSDDDENLTSVCTWCHLFGVHGGRIRAVGTAERIHWELGAAGSPCLVVDGRDRVAA